MKHNTHIYIAAKAIDLIYESVDNTIKPDGEPFRSTAKSKERREATKRQRLLRYHEALITEASWAPDDILRDNHPYHVFKLLKDDEFVDIPQKYLDRSFQNNGETYFKYNGGLPYRIDHIANQIVGMEKLRDYNDQYSLRQIMYLYLMLSHYIVDAHVPMHCDHRDDPPGDGEVKLNGAYMKESAHAALEKLWDEATTPVAMNEEIIEVARNEDRKPETVYSPDVIFDLSACDFGGEVLVAVIPKYGLMDFMVGICFKSKERCRDLFPLDNPTQRDDSNLHALTRSIFADAIGNLMAVWRYVWFLSRKPSEL
ncbi:MAG: hypothetical protein KAT58_04695 [candidate division Zixibacteria bacterium]|nr:hypothetical protein [candidate division Zixibacteria bacterium]